MSNFIGTPPILEPVMGCHENHAYIFKDGLVSHLGGPNEQFGIHKNCPGDAR